MITLLSKKPKLDFDQIHRYGEDLLKMTDLRSKAQDVGEILHYDNIINCMQRVMIFLNTIKEKDLK